MRWEDVAAAAPFFSESESHLPVIQERKLRVIEAAWSRFISWRLNIDIGLDLNYFKIFNFLIKCMKTESQLKGMFQKPGIKKKLNQLNTLFVIRCG